jgi:hypothetical protein
MVSLGLSAIPPYIDFASMDHSSEDVAARTKGILIVQGSTDIVKQSLRRCRLYGMRIEYAEKTYKVKLKLSVENSAEYLAKLLGGFEADLKTKVFLIDMLRPEAHVFLDQKDIKINYLSTALLGFGADPDGSAEKATKAQEMLL